MFQLPHATRISGENAYQRAGFTRTAVAATTALLTAGLLLWPAVAARAATPTCLGQAATIVGTSGDDNPLLGTSGDDVIVGRGGDDVIRGRGGNDLICGNAGADTLEGGDGADTMQGGDGDDTLSGGAGDDRFLGGAGVDTADYSQFYMPSPTEGVNVNLATGQATGEGADHLTGVEGVKGSDYTSDILTASDAGSTLDGGFEADTLIGGASADVLLSGATDADPDTLEGRGGDDTLHLGDEDVLSYEHAPSAVQIDLGLSTASGGDGADVLMGSPLYVIGSRYGDDLIGDENGNILVGGPGRDTMDGAGYYDTLYPGRGDDTLDGGPGSDTVVYGDGTATAGVTVDLRLGTALGGSGNDTLTSIDAVGGTEFDDVIKGGGNPNVLAGGAGDDTLRGRDGNDSLNGGEGNDTLNGGGGLDSCDGESTVSCEF
jgi:Ca2+-binding RTX toxin-like protein